MSGLPRAMRCAVGLAVVACAALAAPAAQAGARWTLPITLSRGAASNLEVAARNGVVVAAWRQNGLLLAAVKLAAGSWSTPSQLSFSTADAAPSVALAATGRAVVAWLEGDGTVAAARLSPPGFEPAEALSGGPGRFYPPLAIANARGDLAVAWFDDPTYTSQLVASALWPADADAFGAVVPHPIVGTYLAPGQGPFAGTLNDDGSVQFAITMPQALEYVTPILVRLAAGPSPSTLDVGPGATPCIGDAAPSSGPLLVCSWPGARDVDRRTDAAVDLTHPVGGSWQAGAIVPPSTYWGGFHPELTALAVGSQGRGLVATTKVYCDSVRGDCGSPLGTDLLVATGNVDAAGIGAPTAIAHVDGAGAAAVLRAGLSERGLGVVVWGTDTLAERGDGSWRRLHAGGFPFAGGTPSALRQDGNGDLVVGQATTSGVQIAALDGAGPQLNVTVRPRLVHVGERMHVIVAAADAWSALAGRPRIDFGDGTPVGTRGSHTYTAAGTYRVLISAADALGNTSHAVMRVEVIA